MRARTVLLGLLLAAALVAPVALASATTKHRHHANPCAAWHVRKLLSTGSWLEFVSFDGRGGMTLSALFQQKLLRLSRTGRLSTLLAPVVFPGAEVHRRKFLYFTTGDGPAIPGAGTIDRLNLKTGRNSVWAPGLTMPNGLVFLPNGDAVVSRDSGTGTGLTRVRAKDPRHPQFNWSPIDDTNGLAVDPTGRWLYADRTFSKNGDVDRLLIAKPRTLHVVGHVGPKALPDDMTIDKHGILYIAGFGDGKIYRLNPYTHHGCPIAGGLQAPTAAVFGGAGWHARDLYVTGGGGNLYELAPPR